MAWSRSANFSAWCRATRPFTAEAVPAITAVRAIPLKSPGMCCSFSAFSAFGAFSAFSVRSAGVQCVDGFHDDRRRDAGARDHLGLGVERGADERDRPGVLVHD